MLTMNDYVSEQAKSFIKTLNKTCNSDKINLELKNKIQGYKDQIKKEKSQILNKIVSCIEKEVLHFDPNYLCLRADFMQDNRIGFVVSIRTASNDVPLSYFTVVYSDHENWEIIQDEGETVLTSKTAIANFAHVETLNCIAKNLRQHGGIGYQPKDIHNLFIYNAEMRYYKSYLIKNLYFY